MKKTYECNNCSCEATISFNFDEVGEEPQFCPFCASNYVIEELEDDMEYPDDGVVDEW